MSEKNNAIFTRRSIRKYEITPIPKEIIEEVIKAAQAAPSAKNRQPWKYLVYSGNAKKEILDIFRQGIAREEKNPMLPFSSFGILDAKNTLNIMENAPVVIMVINTNGKSPFSSLNDDERFTEINDSMSIGASIENMLICAEEIGIGSLWIGNTELIQTDLNGNNEKVLNRYADCYESVAYTDPTYIFSIMVCEDKLVVMYEDQESNSKYDVVRY